MANPHMRRALKWTAGALGVAAGTYAGYAGVTSLRYGHPAPAMPNDADALLDRFMPVFDVAGRHSIHVAAPAEITFAAAGEQDLMALPVVRGIFNGREILLGPLKREAERRARSSRLKETNASLSGVRAS